MASLAGRLILLRNRTIQRLYSTNTQWKQAQSFSFGHKAACAAGLVTGLCIFNRGYGHFPTIEAGPHHGGGKKKKEEPGHHLSYRERRFLSFASVEYEGVAYMTPRDFLEAVTEEEPRPRIGRRKVSKPILDKMLKQTPKRTKGSHTLFRAVQDQGLISYTEYLFLLCVLTKPTSGFNIAFNMFDTDGNSQVDKKEFLVMERSIDLMYRKRLARAKARQDSNEIEKIVLETMRKRSMTQTEDVERKHVWSSTVGTDGETVLNDNDVQNTTLLVHFFGQKGNDVLSFPDFFRFMDNLQTEVLQLEFSEFSKGMPVISEIEFATILLRYTYLDEDEHDEYLARLQERLPEEQGIEFEDFKQFCQFLNNLDDFAISLSLYTLADRGVTPSEFQRAVRVSTGKELHPHVIEVVYSIFDKDGDGALSHKEFISLMKDRLHRGYRSHLIQNQGNWDSFKSCLRNEMKNAG